jgi:predicted GTPase/uncharacterized protein (DUF697 family)
MDDDLSQFLGDIGDYLQALERAVGLIPDTPVSSGFKQKAEENIRMLREMLLEQRPPRFAILGRRGAGKSTLINAIFGEKVANVGAVKAQTVHPTWYDYTGTKGTICLLDTRGVQEGAEPEEAGQQSVLKDVGEAIREQQPDALLFLCKAKEVDAAVGPDIRFLTDLYAKCRNLSGYAPPVLALVTQVDEIDPPDLRSPAEFEDEEKSANIRRAVEVLADHLRESGLPHEALLEVMPVNAYMGFRGDGTVRVDYRWNIEQLVDHLSSRIPNSAQVQFARITQIRRVQRRVARALVNAAAAGAGVIGASPLPGTDLLPLTGLQTSMALAIAYLSGRTVSMATVTEFMAAMGINVGAGFAFREVARQLLKVVPGLGWAASGGVAAAGTYALGEAAIAYFINDVSLEDAKRTYAEEQGME